MSSDDPDLEDALLRSIESPDLKSLVADGADSLLNALTSTDATKDIPVFGVLARVYSAGAQVRDLLFEQKLRAFLSSVSELSELERAEFLARLDREGDKQRIAQALLLILERLDDLAKPEMLARIFESAATGKISTDQMLRMCAVVDRAMFADLQKLGTGLRDQTGVSEETLSALVSVGLVRLGLRQPFQLDVGQLEGGIDGLKDHVSLELAVSSFGWDFVEVVFGFERPRLRVTKIEEAAVGS